MKKVLILAYYFPPMGTGGVQRAVKFAKFLPDFGWQPLIITVKNVEYYSYDESLLEEINNIKIIRTFSLDPLRISYIFKKIINKEKGNLKKNYKRKRFKKIYNLLSKWIFIIDSKLLWIPFAVISSIIIIKKENIPVILTTSPPNSAHIAGLLLKKILKIKWAADFRDYWIMDRISKFPTPLHKFINEFIRRKILKNADHIIGAAEGIIEEVKITFKRNNSDYSLITNGYDPEDFPEKIPEKDNNKFRIIHSGTINYLNNPDNFLSGLELAVKENPDLINDVSFMHVGMSVDYDLRGEAKKRSCNNIIVEKKYVEHKESVKLLFSADLLLIVHSDFCYSWVISTKIFEYLAAGKPILAVIPDGEASDLIKKYNSGIICGNKNIEKIKDAILYFYEKWKDNKILLDSNTIFQIPAELEQYSRKNLTKNLKDVLENLNRRDAEIQ